MSSVGFGLGWQIAMRLDSLANRWDPKYHRSILSGHCKEIFRNIIDKTSYQTLLRCDS